MGAEAIGEVEEDILAGAVSCWRGGREVCGGMEGGGERRMSED